MLFNFSDFLVSVMAGIISGVAVHYICKWLDSYKTKNKSNQPIADIGTIM